MTEKLLTDIKPQPKQTKICLHSCNKEGLDCGGGGRGWGVPDFANGLENLPIYLNNHLMMVISPLNQSGMHVSVEYPQH